jgi:hypothetical protein
MDTLLLAGLMPEFDQARRLILAGGFRESLSASLAA